MPIDNQFQFLKMRQNLNINELNVLFQFSNKKNLGDAFRMLCLNSNSTVEILQILINKNIDIENTYFSYYAGYTKPPRYDDTLYALCRGDYTTYKDKINLLIQNGAKISLTYNNQWNLSEQVKNLIENTFNQNKLLIEGLENNDAQQVKRAITSGAQLSTTDDQNNMAVSKALNSNNHSIKRIFLEKLAQIIPDFNTKVTSFMLVLKHYETNYKIRMPKAFTTQFLSEIVFEHSILKR